MAAREHTAIRADVGDLARADALIPRMSSPGLTLKRSDVVRMALARGLTVLEAEHGKTWPPFVTGDEVRVIRIDGTSAGMTIVTEVTDKGVKTDDGSTWLPDGTPPVSRRVGRRSHYQCIERAKK